LYKNIVAAYVLYGTNNITHGKGYVILMSNNGRFGEDANLEPSVTYTTSTKDLQILTPAGKTADIYKEVLQRIFCI
jgi:hypothetical protein